MSLNHEDLQRIREWMATSLYGTSVENFPVSIETIRNMCRGPMKDVILGLLVTRMRSDEQIKTIRSNLFLHDIVGDSKSTNQRQKEQETRYRKEIKQRKDDISAVKKEKELVTKRIVNQLAKTSKSNAHAEKEVVQLLSTYEKSEFKTLLLMEERVKATSEILKDVHTFVPLLGSETLGSSSLYHDGEDFNAKLTGLKSLHESAVELFDVYSGYRHPIQDFDFIQQLADKVDRDTRELANSGISQTLVERWVQNEQEQAAMQINLLESKFTNVMNPVEEFAAEAEDLYIRLMEVQTNLHIYNNELKRQILKNKKSLYKKFWKVIKDGGVDVRELQKHLDEEKKKARSKAVQGMQKTILQLEGAMDNEEDLLVLINEQCQPAGGNVSEQSGVQKGGVLTGTVGIVSDEGSTSSASSPCSQETLEELTCALFKSFPVCKEQLETTLKDSQRLILDKFPRLCDKLKKYKKGNSEFLADQASSSEQILPYLPIPERALLQDTLFQNYSRNDLDYNSKSENSLNEIFRMGVENEKKVKECQAFMKERGIM